MIDALHTRIRRTAFDLWKGPKSLYPRNENDLIGGNRILRLAMYKGTSIKPIIEARTVYNIFDDKRAEAVLRAVYWDSHTFIRNLPPEKTVTRIPVKFVRISHERLQQWLEAFAGLQTSIQIFAHEDDNLPSCSLQIETSVVDCSFEKVWQVTPGEEKELNRIWQQVWQEMGLALQNAPTIADIEEAFPDTRIEPDHYDFQSYQPTLNLP